MSDSGLTGTTEKIENVRCPNCSEDSSDRTTFYRSFTFLRDEKMYPDMIYDDKYKRWFRDVAYCSRCNYIDIDQEAWEIVRY